MEEERKYSITRWNGRTKKLTAYQLYTLALNSEQFLRKKLWKLAPAYEITSILDSSWHNFPPDLAAGIKRTILNHAKNFTNYRLSDAKCHQRDTEAFQNCFNTLVKDREGRAVCRTYLIKCIGSATGYNVPSYPSAIPNVDEVWWEWYHREVSHIDEIIYGKDKCFDLHRYNTHLRISWETALTDASRVNKIA